MLLTCGVFGLVTLGPGRLLIPLSVLTYWHLLSWAFWAMFYFSAAYLATLLWQRQRILIYHCSVETFLPKLIERTQQADPAARYDGNVLFLPELGVQCSIDATAGDLLMLQATEAKRNPLRWELFHAGVATLCRELGSPPLQDIAVKRNRGAWFRGVFWGLLGVVCLVVAAVSVVSEAPELLRSFQDHWLPGTL